MFEYKINFNEDPIKAFDGLGKAIKNKAIRISMNKAASEMKADAIGNAPSATGSIKKSIRIKIKNYKKGDIWVCFIGPSTKYKRTIGRGENKITKYPAKYWYLQEHGYRSVAGKLFLKKTQDTGAQRYFDSLMNAVEEQLHKVLSK
jgi:HK97 gp10 family phage protein